MLLVFYSGFRLLASSIFLIGLPVSLPQMNVKQLIFLVFLVPVGLVLSSCSKTASCQSDATYKVLSENLIEQVEKKMLSEKDPNTSKFVFESKDKVRASLAQLQVTVESVRTTKEDPNSTKRFCSGVLKVTIPTSMLSDADQSKELENKPKISEDIRTYDIEKNINVFSKKGFEYSVQPTDDGKELYVELESNVWVNMLHDITRSALLKPTLEVQKAEQIRQEQQNKRDSEVQKARQQTDPDTSKGRAMNIPL